MGQNRFPVLLDIVEDERNELYLCLFARIALAIGCVVDNARSRVHASSSEQREEVPSKDEAEQAEEEDPADPEMADAKTAEASEPAATHTVVAMIFYVVANTARSPFHSFNLPLSLLN